MAVFGPEWSRIHQEKPRAIFSPLLFLFSQLYGLGVRFRQLAYRRGLFKQRQLSGFVVSIGNLTTGGTGKTPAVVMLGKWALEKGYGVAILSRGYGGRYAEEVLEVSDGEHIKADPRKTGDEPYLLAEELKGIPILISRKRFLAGSYAHQMFDTEFFILDDGFQHLELKRDLDLVLLDSSRPFGNGHLLPWGPLREPIGQLVRADALIVTRLGKRVSRDGALDFLKKQFPAIPSFCADHVPDRVVFPYLNEEYEPGFLRGKRVLAFAGIAQPEEFKETLEGVGADIAYFKGFRDHYRFRLDEINTLIKMKEELGAQYLITTQKDWMRISPEAPTYPNMGYLSINFILVSGQDDFFEMVNSAFLDYRRNI